MPLSTRLTLSPLGNSLVMPRRLMRTSFFSPAFTSSPFSSMVSAAREASCPQMRSSSSLKGVPFVLLASCRQPTTCFKSFRGTQIMLRTGRPYSSSSVPWKRSSAVSPVRVTASPLLTTKLSAVEPISTLRLERSNGPI